MKFSIRKFSDIDRSDWDALFLRCRSPSLANSEQWISAAVATWGIKDVEVVIGERGDTLLFAQPLEISSRNNDQVSLQFLRTPTTDAIEPLGVDGLSTNEFRAFIRFMINEFAADQIIVASASERLFERLKSVARESQLEVGKTRRGTELLLPESTEEFWAALKSGHRSLLRRKIRKAENSGLTFRVISQKGSVDTGNCIDALGRLTELHRKRFDSMGQESFFVKDDIQKFHNKLICAGGDTLTIEFVECLKDGEVIGSVYGVSTRSDYVFLMTGFDPDFQEFSVGFLSIYHSVERAISRGIRRYDFKVGAERYKKWWSTDSYSVYDLCLFPNRGFAHAVRAAVSGVLNTLKRGMARRLSEFPGNPFGRSRGSQS